MRDAHAAFVREVNANLKKQNLSLTELARRAGLRDNTLYRLTSSEPKISRVAAICEALGLEFYIGPPRYVAEVASLVAITDTETDDLPAEADDLPVEIAEQLEAARDDLARLEAMLRRQFAVQRRAPDWPPPLPSSSNRTP